jgi:PAS domain protein
VCMYVIVLILALCSAVLIYFLRKALRKNKRLECIFRELPVSFSVSTKDGDLSHVHHKHSALSATKRLRELGAKEERVFKRSFRELSDTDISTSQFEFDSSASPNLRFEAQAKKLPRNLFKNDSYLISVSDITERHEKQKRADILLEHEKAFRIALQMIAQNKGFDEFSQWLLENLLNWLGADRTQIYRIDQDTGKAALAAEYSASEKKENTVDLIPLNSQFRAALSAQKIIAYDCSKPNENESLDAVCDKLKSLDVKSAAFFGIISSENLSGLISVEFFRNRKKFSEYDFGALANISKIIQIAQDRKESFEKLKQNEARKNTILQTIDCPVILFDPKGNIVTVNEATAKIVNKSIPEITGCLLFNGICHKNPQDENCSVNIAIGTKKQISKRITANEKIYDLTYTPVLDADGNIAYIVMIASNVSAAEEAT